MKKILNLRKKYRAEVIETVDFNNRYNMLNLQNVACRMIYLWWIVYMIALTGIVLMLSIGKLAG